MKRCVGDLGKGLNIVQSTISHHIKELRIAGLIHVEKRGKHTECRVDEEAVRVLSDLLLGRLGARDTKASLRAGASGEGLCKSVFAQSGD